MQNLRKKLTISVVIYNQDLLILENLIKSLNNSVKNVWDLGLIPDKLFIADNSDKLYELTDTIEKLISENWDFPFKYYRSNANLGFGRAHNFVLNNITEEEFSSSDLHLVLNPDVVLDENCIKNAYLFMQNNPDAGMVTPKSFKENNVREYLCKRYPSIFDLFLRGFAPNVVKSHFKKRLERYEMKNETQDSITKDILIASGCFMFLRNAAIKETGGFDPAFFLYFEDFDFSLRLTKKWKICYLPDAKIIHHGGQASKKGIKHILYFIRSGITFYNKHGWRFL